MRNTPSESSAGTPFPFLMDQAEPEPPAELSFAEAFTFANVPHLSASLKRGEEAAFAWLHGQWSGRIHRYCLALSGGDETAARETTQAVWIRLARHVRVVRDEQALWSWIACAARHASTDQKRKCGRYFRALRRFTDWWRPAASEPDDRLFTALEVALGKLDSDDRALIESRYFCHESLDTLATRHALTIRAVEGRLARLRVRLRELIAKEIQP